MLYNEVYANVIVILFPIFPQLSCERAEEDKLKVVEKMLEALEILVTYGFYWRNAKDLLEKLIELLGECVVEHQFSIYS